VQLRQTGWQFKLVLVTNSTLLNQTHLRDGLALFLPQDEVWAKLDGGTQDYLNQFNGSTVSLAKILGNNLGSPASGRWSSKACFPRLTARNRPPRRSRNMPGG
jgi:hypothetical protein